MVGGYSSAFHSVQLSEPPLLSQKLYSAENVTWFERDTTPQPSPKDLCIGASLGRRTQPQLQSWPQMLPDPTRTARFLTLLSQSQPRKLHPCTRMAILERLFLGHMEGYHLHQIKEPPWRIKSNIDQ